MKIFSLYGLLIMRIYGLYFWYLFRVKVFRETGIQNLLELVIQ